MIKISFNERLNVFDVEHSDGSWFVTRNDAATELRQQTGLTDDTINELLDDVSDPEVGIASVTIEVRS